MKSLCTLLLFVALAFTGHVFGQDLVRTSDEVIATVNPVDSGYVSQIVNAIEFDFENDLIKVRMTNAYLNVTEQGDTVWQAFRYNGRAIGTRILSELTGASPEYAAIVSAIKQAMILYLSSNNSGLNSWGSDSWIPDSLSYEIRR